MKDQVTHHVGVIKTTAIGGIFFLFPLVIVGVLVGQVVQWSWTAAKALKDYLPAIAPSNYILLFIVTLLFVLLICFVAGIVARRSLARRFTHTIEGYLLMLFPRYAIFKEQLTGNIGSGILRNQLRPVLVLVPEGQRMAMEVERGSVDGTQWVTVFFPGSPDPWSGNISLVEAFRVKPLNGSFNDAVATAEQLGRGTLKLLESSQ